MQSTEMKKLQPHINFQIENQNGNSKIDLNTQKRASTVMEKNKIQSKKLLL